MPQALLQARVPAPTVDLGISCQARQDGVAHIIVCMFLAKLARELRPFGTRANQTHLAAQDVPQLRQFIEPVSTQVEADSRTSRIARNGPYRSEMLFSVFMHGTKLDNRELFSAESNPDLPIEDRPVIGESDARRNRGKKGRKDQKTGCRSADVQRTLQKAIQSNEGFMRAVT